MKKPALCSGMICVLTMLVACSEAPQPPIPAPELSPDLPPSEPIAGANGILTATPGSGHCDTPIDVDIAWRTPLESSPDGLQIWAGKGDDDSILFAKGSSSGSQRTGNWVSPGTVFRIIEGAGGKELDRITIGGGPCPAATADGNPT
ncbi:MAG: hypothetical protein Q4G62_11555 [Pseudomonadota bacterium]|nr:hypothetical protein [Pseudomonadota bacterium]